MAMIARCCLFLGLFLCSVPCRCAAQEIVQVPAASTSAPSGFGSKADEDSFKASVKTEVLGQNLWKPMMAESRQLSVKASLSAVGLLAFFLMGPTFWTLSAMCGAGAVYWGSAALVGGAVLVNKMPGGEGAYLYVIAGGGALALVLLSWVAMLIVLLPPLLNLITAVSGRLGGGNPAES